MDIEVEGDAALVNLIFFSYELCFLADANVYELELKRIVRTSSRKLEAAFIAGLIGPRMPPKEEFDRIVADKMIEAINNQKRPSYLPRAYSGSLPSPKLRPRSRPSPTTFPPTPERLRPSTLGGSPSELLL